MSDINCPYCNHSNEVCHDDGEGYEEDKLHEMHCYECEKYFTFYTTISLHYKSFKADCLNGKEHKLKPVHSTARDIWPDWVRCTDCDYEDRGKVSKEGLRIMQGN